MKRFLFFAMVLGMSQSALAGVAFKCMGDQSRFEIIQGFYGGEAADTITFKSSSIYNIHNKENYGSPLTLNRDRNNRVRGVIKDYPIQFSAKQKDDLGSSTTVFAIPIGVFGGSVGKQFKAVLATDHTHVFDCETVSTVNLR